MLTDTADVPEAPTVTFVWTHLTCRLLEGCDVFFFFNDNSLPVSVFSLVPLLYRERLIKSHALSIRTMRTRSGGVQHNTHVTQ